MQSGTPRNRILSALSIAQFQRVESIADFVRLERRRVLIEVNTPVEHVYFLEDGMVSLVSVLADGTGVEAAVIGSEGMVGLPVFLGSISMSAQAFVQVEGSAYRVRSSALLEEIGREPELRLMLGRYTQALMTMLAQNSACNRRHSILERCARWLLLTADSVNAPTFDITQEFMAMMLGVRRASVTEATAVLQKQGWILHDRGVITVIDRSGLEGACCECYLLVRNEYSRLVGTGDVFAPVLPVVSEHGYTKLPDRDPVVP
jgi:CRP-like cAMP-binding protein